MKELYELYGQLMIQQELLSSRIQAVKREIAQKLQQPVKEEKVDDNKRSGG